MQVSQIYWNGVGLVCLAIISSACGGRKAREISSDGLIFRLNSAAHLLEVQVSPSAPKYTAIGIPNSVVIMLRKGSQSFAQDGTPVDPSIMEKRREWGVEDLVFLRPGMIVSFTYADISGGSLEFSANKGFSTEVEAVMAKMSAKGFVFARLWKGPSVIFDDL